MDIKTAVGVDIENLLCREPITLNVSEISLYLSEQVVLVTGGGGSIGSELCRQIAKFSPKKLIILDNYENNAYEIQIQLKSQYPSLNLDIVIANIREEERMNDVFETYRPEVVFHAAAHKHVPLMELNPIEAIVNNIFGTLNVAKCADRFLTSKFVLISTDKAINPTSVMGITKKVAEMIVQSINMCTKTKFVSVRFGNVLGSNGSVVPLMLKQIQRGGPVTVTHPEVTRFFMTISEAAQLVIQAGAMAEGGEIFVLNMGNPIKIYDLAQNLIRMSGMEPERDIMIEFIGLRPGEKLHEEFLPDGEILNLTKNNKILITRLPINDWEIMKKQIDRLKGFATQDVAKALDYIHSMIDSCGHISKIANL